jgi:hypothetical protein
MHKLSHEHDLSGRKYLSDEDNFKLSFYSSGTVVNRECPFNLPLPILQFFSIGLFLTELI